MRALLVLLFAASTASAAPISVRARPGDTVETLAAAYYGNHAFAALLADVNHVPRGQALAAGRTVRIPTAATVRARRGDTFESLARRVLGDARRAPWLASWNNLHPDSKLAEGAPVVVPFVLLHKCAAPESFTSLARTYYGDPTQSRLLEAFNFRGGPVAAAGDKIVVPFPTLHVRRVRLAAATAHAHSTAAGDVAARGEAEVAARVAARLELAQKAFAEGNYADVPPALTKLLSEEDPSEAQLVEIHRLLVCAYVALGADEVAVQEAREVLARAPDLALDPATVSPKIRAAFDRARRP